MKKEYLFIIPARSKSKRLKGKNLKRFKGKPLVFWTIEQALRFSKFGYVVLTTDSKNTINKCSIFSDLLVSKRPDHLATDEASLIDVALYTANKLNFKKSVVILQPTSPLRKDVDIKKGLSILKNGASAVMSQTKLQYNSSKLGLINKKNNFSILNLLKSELYAPNGSFFGAKYGWLKKNNSFYNKTVKTFNMPAERSIDIDDKYQFIMAEALMK